MIREGQRDLARPAVELAKLEQAIRFAWTEDTSSDPGEWRKTNPAWGQCAVTACVIQDYIGGEIVWSEARLPDGRRVSHYFNHGSSVIDLTREQFPQGTEIPAGVEKRKEFPSTRAYVLSFEATRKRYETLAARVIEALHQQS